VEVIYLLLDPRHAIEQIFFLRRKSAYLSSDLRRFFPIENDSYFMLET
jgi:hypothetical protein